MASQLRLSEKIIENFVVKKIEWHLQNVRWGKNCFDVREALSFDSSLFTVDGPYNIDKSALEEYLLHNGFAPKGNGSRRHGMKWEKWYFPVEPKNPKLAEIRSKIEESYKDYLEMVEEQARRIVSDFVEVSFETTSYVVNKVQYKALEKMIQEVNRETLVLNNKLNALYQRPFIKCVQCETCPVAILIKNGNPDAYIATATSDFFKLFYEYLYGIITYANAEMRFSALKNGKVCMYIPAEYYEQFEKLFGRVEIKFSNFPKYEVSEYTVISENMSNSPYHMPIFMELGRMTIQDLIPDNPQFIQVAINNEYKKFCKLINMKLGF